MHCTQNKTEYGLAIGAKRICRENEDYNKYNIRIDIPCMYVLYGIGVIEAKLRKINFYLIDAKILLLLINIFHMKPKEECIMHV